MSKQGVIEWSLQVAWWPFYRAKDQRRKASIESEFTLTIFNISEQYARTRHGVCYSPNVFEGIMQMSTSALPEIENHKVIPRVEALRRFRQKWKRYDYYPTQDALLRIEQLRKLNPEHSINELIDFLVLRETTKSS
jgi:hypothetical protein